MKNITDYICEGKKQVELTDEQISAIKNVIDDCSWQEKNFNASGDDCDHIAVSMTRSELDALLSIKF